MATHSRSLFLENPHGQRSLVGYSPWGCKESDRAEVTEHARTHTCTGLTNSLGIFIAHQSEKVHLIESESVSHSVMLNSL